MQSTPNPALNLAPFGRWTLRDKAAQRRLALRSVYNWEVDTVSQQEPRERKLVEGFARTGILIDFDNLSAHCNFLARGLAGESERFEAYVREKTAELDQDERDHFFEMHSDDHWRINDVFPALQAASAFLLTYAVFEKSLNDICCYSNCQQDLGLSFKDFRGQGIERAKLYLSKVCGLSSVFEGKEWQEVLQINNLRNSVSHASGELDLANSQHKKAFEYAKTREDIKAVRHAPDADAADVALTLDFVKHSVESLRSFLVKVCSQRVVQNGRGYG